MTDYGNIISSTFGQSQPALSAVVGNIDEDPERAQRTIDLANATGVPPTSIWGDLDEFERQQKAHIASAIVGGNPHLQDFVQSNPMVPRIANDDYGNLDAVSAKVAALALPLRTSLQALVTPSKAFQEGYGEGSLSETFTRSEDWETHPTATRVFGAALSPVALAMRTLSGVTFDLAHEVLGDKYGTQAAQALMDPGLQASLVGMGPHGAVAAGILEAVGKLHPVAAWIRNGREPPAGVMPELDKFRADQNAEDVTALKDATSEAAQSLTRERSPDLFKQFIQQHTDAEIGISGEAVAALYGDKVPDPGDALLGWVPEIESKINLARSTGADVSIPLSDWLTHVADNPEVMKALEDDIRVRPNGITKNEAKLASEAAADNPPSIPLPEEAPAVRASAALEPLLSIGDRKLELQRLTAAEGSKYTPATGYHDFTLNDEKGNPLGVLNISTQKDGKQLYVDNIEGINGLGPRDFGPALMRDILRQLKAEFPEAESVTGHRVSGARDRAGSYMDKSASPVIKLDNPKGWDTVETAGDWMRVLEGGRWETYSPKTQAYIKPYMERTVGDRKLIGAVEDELNRIAPQKLNMQAADRIASDNIAGQTGPVRPSGTYIQYREAYPIILYSLEHGDALGTARHEAIHHLRNYGFFAAEEWSTLEQASKDNKWVEQFGIDRRYAAGNERLKLEESIADAYKHWEAGRGEVAPEVASIFQKMKEFFDRLRQRIGELLGKDPTWEDIFKKVSTGEVGRREGTEPLNAEAFNEKLSVSEEPEGGSRVFERANAIGMTVDQFKRYDELIQQRHAEDIEAATKRAQTEQAREHTKQWKDDRKALRQEVSEEIRNRPDVAADLFFGAGELYGKKIPLASVKLDASALTPEQKAGLPRTYYGEKGIHPDDVANIFGYGSGDAMVEKLIQYNSTKKASGMSARDFVSRVTDIETDRQMKVRYGSLEDNIMDAVKDQVLSETQLNILAEETHALGMKVGQAPLSKDIIVDAVRQEFAKTSLASINSDRYMATAGKAGREAELALLKNDPAAAFQAKQRQFYATVLAREAVKLEKEMGKFEKVAKRFSKREVASVDQEYTNFIHDILMRVGKPVRRSVQDLETEIGVGEYHTLKDFVEGKQSYYLREVAVADILFDQNFRKKFEDLTVDEFNATNTSIKSLLANGRDEKKITKAGVAEDLDVVRGQMVESLRRFQEKTYDAKGGRWMGAIPPKQAAILRTFGIDHLQMETIFNRWDNADPHGPFQQYVMRDLVQGANSESAKRKTYAARLLTLDDKSDLKKLVDNPLFKVPNTDQVMKLNRGNLRAILMNAGNTSNLTKLAKGYGLQGEQVMAWLHQHATKADWDWAQKLGDTFADLKAEADVMYRNLSGVAPESIKLAPVDTPHGQYPGWYYPLIAHPEFEGPSKRMMGKNALEQDGYVRATTANGYTKARTGAIYPLALDLDMMPYRIGQMIHDTEMRPAIINASKIMYDKDVRAEISTRFGNEWRDMMVPYLVDVANSANYMTKGQKRLANVSEFIRQNMITTLVGLNPGTFLKHTPTALVQSIHEVGGKEFVQAMRSLWSINERTGESNWQFAMRESEELQRRHSHFQETLGGAADSLIPTSGFASLRATVQRYAATPVAMGDLVSAVPTWLAQYTKEINVGATHGDAVYMADRSVRRAHGSTAITNRSAVMRSGYNPWLASVYGFFNHIMNRQYEMTWKAGEAIDAVKDSDTAYTEAMQQGKSLTAQLFAYVVAPAIIEELVSPLASEDGESWGKKAAKGLAYTLGASWIGVRDFVNAALMAKDPGLGLMTTAMKTLADPIRDMTKDRPLSKEHAGKLVKDASTLLGTSTGLFPAQAGKVMEFGYGVHEGVEHPRGPWGWLTGMRYGTLKGHPETFDQWKRHNLGVR